MQLRSVAAASLAALIPLVAQAQKDPATSPLTLGAGLHYSSGDYGSSTTTSITSLAATARYETGPWVFRAFLPYLEVTGDNSVIPGIGRVRGGGAARNDQAGMGDLSLAATYTAFYDPASTFGFDLTGKLKLGTADESKGLGTGEHDVVFLAEAYRTFGRTTAFGGVGYHVLGDPPGANLENVWSINFGASYKIDERDSAGAAFDTRQRVAPGASPQRELMGFFTRKFDSLWKAQLYALIGLADGSPDWGAGVHFARPF